MVEAALRSATPTSLALAAKRLPAVPVAVLAKSPIARGGVVASAR